MSRPVGLSITRPRLVFDTSTLVSAALRIGSLPHQALEKALGEFILCSSSTTLTELELVLNRRKFDHYLDLEARQAFAQLIRRNTHVFEVTDEHTFAVKPPCRDPKDTPFLALALAAEAAFLISSDEDLLVLNPWQKIAILTPAQFLSAKQLP